MAGVLISTYPAPGLNTTLLNYYSCRSPVQDQLDRSPDPGLDPSPVQRRTGPFVDRSCPVLSPEKHQFSGPGWTVWTAGPDLDHFSDVIKNLT